MESEELKETVELLKSGELYKRFLQKKVIQLNKRRIKIMDKKERNRRKNEYTVKNYKPFMVRFRYDTEKELLEFLKAKESPSAWLKKAVYKLYEEEKGDKK